MRLSTSSILALSLCAWGVFAQQQQTYSSLEAIRSALRNKNFDEAIELSRSALRSTPHNAQLWTLQGIAFAGKGDNANALDSFKRALKVDPNNLGALAGGAHE